MTQTLLTIRNDQLQEFPVADKHTLKDHFYGYAEAQPERIIYGYILNRNPQFKNAIYNWGVER